MRGYLFPLISVNIESKELQLEKDDIDMIAVSASRSRSIASRVVAITCNSKFSFFPLSDQSWKRGSL